MGENTEIAWTDHTWNPWQGCRRVRTGCKNCYMFRDKKRYGQDGADIHLSAQSTFNKPLHWKDPAKVFTCSWSDFFIEEADPWRPDAWDIIRRTPHLTYQILTKRPERIKDCLPGNWPLPNVWLGVTVESQREDNRIMPLLHIPAAVHFISVEPMVGPVNILPYWGRMLDWVICGGESGPNYRRMLPEWAAGLKADCDDWKIPFFMKQMAGLNPKNITIPDYLNVREFPVTGQEAAA